MDSTPLCLRYWMQPRSSCDAIECLAAIGVASVVHLAPLSTLLCRRSMRRYDHRAQSETTNEVVKRQPLQSMSLNTIHSTANMQDEVSFTTPAPSLRRNPKRKASSPSTLQMHQHTEEVELISNPSKRRAVRHADEKSNKPKGVAPLASQTLHTDSMIRLPRPIEQLQEDAAAELEEGKRVSVFSRDGIRLLLADKSQDWRPFIPYIEYRMTQYTETPQAGTTPPNPPYVREGSCIWFGDCETRLDIYQFIDENFSECKKEITHVGCMHCRKKKWTLKDSRNEGAECKFKVNQHYVDSGGYAVPLDCGIKREKFRPYHPDAYECNLCDKQKVNEKDRIFLGHSLMAGHINKVHGKHHVVYDWTKGVLRELRLAAYDAIFTYPRAEKRMNWLYDTLAHQTPPTCRLTKDPDGTEHHRCMKKGCMIEAHQSHVNHEGMPRDGDRTRQISTRKDGTKSEWDKEMRKNTRDGLILLEILCFVHHRYRNQDFNKRPFESVLLDGYETSRGTFAGMPPENVYLYFGWLKMEGRCSANNTDECLFKHLPRDSTMPPVIISSAESCRWFKSNYLTSHADSKASGGAVEKGDAEINKEYIAKQLKAMQPLIKECVLIRTARLAAEIKSKASSTEKNNARNAAEEETPNTEFADPYNPKFNGPWQCIIGFMIFKPLDQLVAALCRSNAKHHACEIANNGRQVRSITQAKLQQLPKLKI